ncbi:MAG: PilZ domain-containing protein [Phycisphaeraceae bacterium]|nr:PilZ domain-containing protein [Phycisphaeraceae bacterium]
MSREKVAWGVGFGRPLNTAMVRDVSDSGIGLRCDGDVQPRVGATIRLLSRRSDFPHRARIVRVKHEAGETTLGCEWASSNEHCPPEFTHHANRHRVRSH